MAPYQHTLQMVCINKTNLDNRSAKSEREKHEVNRKCCNLAIYCCSRFDLFNATPELLTQIWPICCYSRVDQFVTDLCCCSRVDEFSCWSRFDRFAADPDLTYLVLIQTWPISCWSSFDLFSYANSSGDNTQRDSSKFSEAREHLIVCHELHKGLQAG